MIFLSNRVLTLCQLTNIFLMPRYIEQRFTIYNSDRKFRNVSVRPSVCLSVTCRYCVKTKKASVMISILPGSPKILVFLTPNFILKF